MTDTDTAFGQALEPLIRGRLEYRAAGGDSDAQQLLDRLTNAWANLATDTRNEREAS